MIKVRYRGLSKNTGEWVEGCLYWHLNPKNEVVAWILPQYDNVWKIKPIGVYANSVEEIKE